MLWLKKAVGRDRRKTTTLALDAEFVFSRELSSELDKVSELQDLTHDLDFMIDVDLTSELDKVSEDLSSLLDLPDEKSKPQIRWEKRLPTDI